MRMLFLCFVVVLFISDNAANPVDSVDIVEASGEKENLTRDENTKSAEKSVDKSVEKSVETSVEKSVIEQLNGENEMPAEVVRSKKSNYPSAPYSNTPYPSAPYPSAPYASAPYSSAPYPSASYPSAPCGCSSQYAQQSINYGAPQSSYGSSSYGGYSAPFPGYGQPQYSRPKYGKRKGNSYVKYQPSYQSQGYYQSPQPSYQSPQPSYQSPQPSYQSPQPSYQSPEFSYQSPQPSYQPSQPSYQSAPSSSSSYANQEYVGSAPSQTYSYPSAAPNVQCGSNLLVGCQPHVSQVPCSGYSPSSYGSSNYGQPQSYAPGYRSADNDATVSTSSNDGKTSDTSDEHKSKTTASKDNQSVSSILSAPTNHIIDKGATNDNKDNAGQQKDATVSATNGMSPEEAAQKKFEMLMKMSEVAKSLANDVKDLNQKPQKSQPNQQQNQLMPPNQQQNQLMPSNEQRNQMMSANQQHNQLIPPNQQQNQFMPPNPQQNQLMPPNQQQNPLMPPNPQQNQLMPTGPHNTNEKPQFSAPPPTSANVGINPGPNNQVSSQFIPQQHPAAWV